MTIDKYTKFILTLIAVGVIGINFHLFNGSIVKEVKAELTDYDLRGIEKELGGIKKAIRGVRGAIDAKKCN